jgi:NitT/TauT family transport system ATP-binding protein
MTKPLLALQQISRVYQSEEGRPVLAVHRLTTEFRAGDFICLLGPTGCGKTTLLRLIAGLEKPTEGMIFLEGQPLQGLNCQVGYVFQDSALFPWIRAVDNVAFPLKMQGALKKERRKEAARWLARVGLKGFERAFPHELSGGMARRVALARALIVKPPILLLDEPFSALDERTRHRLEVDLLDLWQETGCTVIFVTHDVEEAVFLGKRIFLLGHAPKTLRKIISVPMQHPRDRLDEVFVSILVEIRREFEKLIE